MNQRPLPLGRGPLFLTAGMVLLAGAMYLAFELGRFQAGYSLLDQRRSQAALQLIIDRQEVEADELRRQLTALQMSQEIDRETYALVETSLAELQQQIQEQEEELAFYEGIISPEDGNPGLRVQTVAVLPSETANHFQMRLVLVQALSHDRRVSGVVRVSIDGTLDDIPATLEGADFVPDATSGDIDFDFRYWQELEREIAFPRNFEPNRVNVAIHPQGVREDPILHNYDWVALTG